MVLSEGDVGKIHRVCRVHDRLMAERCRRQLCSLLLDVVVTLLLAFYVHM